MAAVDRDLWVRVKELFAEALERSPAERTAYLAEMCGSDVGLRREVESLLAAHEDGTGAASPTVGASELVAESVRSPERETCGRVGPYKLLERIGEGGFGSVYLAEQREPVQRRVALKVIKPGMDSRQVIARFEAERQALAMMDHPNIARVLDAGTTQEAICGTGSQPVISAGLPYFVMELVRGIPITKFCDENHLTIRQRLELFEDVCHAVQHAHMKGVIHRDLKPTNVLVTLHDDKPVPKVIDFGIAKACPPFGGATQGRLTDKTLFTEFRQLIGTPAYMSPEQAQLSGIDIDTRSDIYSLGVLLYELLTGTTPFDAKTLLDSGYDEMRRIIREVEPPRPSTRIGTLRVRGSGIREQASETTSGQSPPGPHSPLPDSSSAIDIARHRHADPATLSRLLRGDLDWIVMKCLEKDRSRRYETANGLSADVQRHLEGAPVLAAPPSKFYHLRKTLRRHRGPVAAAAGFLLLILSGTVVSTIFWQRAEHESAAARTEAQKAAQIGDFLRHMLASANPANARRNDVSLREVLDGAAREIEGRFGDHPLVEAELRITLGNAYDGLGEYDIGETHLRRALVLLRRELGDEHAQTLKTTDDLAQTLQHAGRYGDAEPLFVETLATCRRGLGDEHDLTLILLNNLGLFYWGTSRYAEAEPLLRRALAIHLRKDGEEHDATLTVMNNLALVAEAGGYYAEAETLSKRVLEIRRRMDPENPALIEVMDNLATLYVKQERYAEAEPLRAESVEMSRRIWGPEHPITLTFLSNLAVTYGYQHRYSESLPLSEEVLAVARRVLGEEHPQTLGSKRNLATEYAAVGRWEDAARLATEVLEIQRRDLGPRHQDTLITMNNAAMLNRTLGRFDEAEPLYREALAAQTELFGEDHLETLRSMHNLAVFYREVKRYDDAEVLAVRALEKLRRVLGEEHTLTISAMVNLGLLRDAQDRPEEAEPLLRASVEISRRVLPETHDFRIGWLNNLTNFLAARRRLAEAEPFLLEARELARKAYGDDSPQVAMNLHHWADALRAAGRLDEAVTAARESHEMYRAHPDWPAGEARHARGVLIGILNQRGDWEESVALNREGLDDLAENKVIRRLSLAAALAGWGKVLLASGDPGAAESVLRECVEVRTELFRDGDKLAWLRYNAMSMLGEARAMLAAGDAELSAAARSEKFAEAERLLTAGYEGLRAAPGEPPPSGLDERRREALARIVSLYDAWNTAEPRDDLASKAAHWRGVFESDAPAPETPKPGPSP